jgi:predicted nucleic acid-binding protein
VLLKWVLPEPEIDTEQALGLREAAIAKRLVLAVPPLWLYEIGNTLARRYPGNAQALIEALQQGPLRVTGPTRTWLRRTLELTIEHGVTFYDASYHALALVNRGLFVTADARYARKAGPSNNEVQLLKDWTE